MRRSERPFGLYQQRGSKVWWCRIRGHRQSTGKRDYGEALAEAFERDRRAADPTHLPPKKTTFALAVARFRESKRAAGRAAGTFHMYGVKVGHLARLFAQGVDLDAAVTAATVDRYIIARRDQEEASEHTIHKELGVLWGILRVAKREGCFRADLDNVKPATPFSAQYVPRKTFLTPSQLDRMLAELEPNHAAAAAFLVAGACRLGDMTRAEASDFTAKPGWIRIHATKTKANREGDRYVRVTRLNADLVKRIKRWTAGRTIKLFVRWTNIQRDLAKACERASACAKCRHTREQRRSENCTDCARIEIVPRVSPNDLRRTASTWLKQERVADGDVAAELGHADSRMVERVYGRLSPEDRGAVIDAALSDARSRAPVRLVHSGPGRRARR